MKILFPLFSGCLVLLSLLIGCSKTPRPAGFPSIYPCKIVLKQGENPLVDATVTLFSQDQSCSWAIGGTTDSQGVATLITHGRFKGAPEGRFVVTVTKTESEGHDQGEFRTKPIKIYSLVDMKYQENNSSPLELVIKKGKNQFEFDLGPPIRVLSETISPRGA